MSTSSLQPTDRVSAKLMAGEEADAIVAAARIDNPEAYVEDHGTYLTVYGNGRLDFNIDSIAEELGRPYTVPTLLVVLSSYTGQVEIDDRRLSITEALTG